MSFQLWARDRGLMGSVCLSVPLFCAHDCRPTYKPIVIKFRTLVSLVNVTNLIELQRYRTMPKGCTVTMEIKIFEGNLRSLWNWAQKLVFTIWPATVKFSYVGLHLKVGSWSWSLGFKKNLTNCSKTQWKFTVSLQNDSNKNSDALDHHLGSALAMEFRILKQIDQLWN